MTPDTRTTENPEALLDKIMNEWDHDEAIAGITAALAEAAQGAAPRAEGLALDVERLQRAILRVRRHLHEQGMEPEITAKDADLLAAEYARLKEGTE